MKAYLILANGKVFEGESVGVSGEVIGEVVFTTAMTGYMETLTDPSLFGQILTHTFPLIGNYGSIKADAESDKTYLSGYVVRELCSFGSNYRKDGELNDYLKANNIVGIEGVDTRELTKILRDSGVMDGMITTSKSGLEDKIARIKAFKVKNAVLETTTKEVKTFGNGSRKVVLWDFGAKKSIVDELVKRDCTVLKVPATYSAEQIASLNPDGILLSNGGGDPNDNLKIVQEIKKLCAKKIPMFGICIGHLLLALANGAKTAKLKYGHRGENQPAKDAFTGKVYITTQNHGYAVVNKSVDTSIADVWFTNVNDKTCEGIKYKNMPAFSVQFNPQGSGGPLDTVFMFDDFVAMMDNNTHNKESR